MKRKACWFFAAALALGATTAAVGVGASGSRSAAEASVRTCAVDDLVRYSTPTRAPLLQHFDVATACRVALSGEDGDQFDLTPVGQPGRVPGTAPRSETSLPRVRLALARSSEPRTPAVLDLVAGPTWLLALLAASAFSALAGIIVEVARRLR